MLKNPHLLSHLIFVSYVHNGYSGECCICLCKYFLSSSVMPIRSQQQTQGKTARAVDILIIPEAKLPQTPCSSIQYGSQSISGQLNVSVNLNALLYRSCLWLINFLRANQRASLVVQRSLALLERLYNDLIKGAFKKKHKPDLDNHFVLKRLLIQFKVNSWCCYCHCERFLTSERRYGECLLFLILG